MSSRGVAVSLRDRYEATAGRVQMTGIQALARIPIEQHRRDRNAGLATAIFISGYEGSPLAGLDLELGRIRDLLEQNEVTFVPALNEESAATAVQGSQLVSTLDAAIHDGVVGVWYGKAPGLDRAADALRHGNLMGAHPAGGAVVLVGDDPGAKSSSVPCSSEFALADLAIPFLYPADSGEVIDYGLHAVELSRSSGLWVGLKIVTSVADGSSTVELLEDRPLPRVPRGGKRHVPTGRLLQPALGPLERDQLTTRMRLATEYSRLNELNRTVGRGASDVLGIVASGRTWLDVVTTLGRLGIDEDDLEGSRVRLLNVGMPFPLAEDVIQEFAVGLDEIVVVEEKRSFVEARIRDALYDMERRPRVTGKQSVDGSDLFPAYGELDVDVIIERLAGRLVAHGVLGALPPGRPDVPAGRTRLSLATTGSGDERRTPYFCSGCPHSTSTRPLDGALVGAGIGCHAMVLLMDEAQVGSVTGLSQMGGEGLQWIGMSPFIDRSHYVQNLGDGTFDHSGSLAVRAAVAAGVDITYKLLYNSAVAMTGGQQAVGAMSVPQIVDVLLAEGVARVIVTTEDRSRYRRVRLPRSVKVWDRARMGDAQRVLESTPGVTVLIHDQECATERRRRRRRAGTGGAAETRVVIDERVCEGCGDCGRKSNCLSVQPVDTPLGRRTEIHQGSCNLDYRCLDGDCPAFLTVQPGAPGSDRAGASSTTTTLDGSDLPAPPSIPEPQSFDVRLAGIGGTGVVTVSQVLAMAGMLAGWNVRSLDQTGLAQKGGAVVSDVRLSRHGQQSNKLATGECDLLLGCDLLVASDAANLAVASSARTVAVLSTSEVPTGRMVSDASVSFPDVSGLADRVRDRAKSLLAVDARAIAVGIFGDDQYANMMIVGMGFQTGGLPLPVAAIEEAIALNGVAVGTNLQAFRRGRQFVVEPDVVLEVARDGRRPAPAEPRTLDELVRNRADELADYQDAGYAARYESVVGTVRRAEEAVRPGSMVFADAVARHLFKLMAYKDEYEVARLLTRPERAEVAREAVGPGARISWNLHPPVLRALGVDRKLRLGPWFGGVLVVLRALRRLRGTAFDPFGRAHVRRVERQLVKDYVEIIDRLARDLTSQSFESSVHIAQLPDMVRGYEDVKLANVERYQRAMADALDALASERQGGRS